MSLLDNYKFLLVESLHCRSIGDGYGEDLLLDRLDGVWGKMSQGDRDAASAFTSTLANRHLDANGKIVVPLDIDSVNL